MAYKNNEKSGYYYTGKKALIIFLLNRKMSSKDTQFIIWPLNVYNYAAYVTQLYILISLNHRKTKWGLGKWKLQLHYVIMFPPLHYLDSCTHTPPLHHHHGTPHFIASICFCFLDFPSESMFTAWVALFYVLQSSRHTLLCHPLSPPLRLPFFILPKLASPLGPALVMQGEGIQSLHILALNHTVIIAQCWA